MTLSIDSAVLGLRVAQQALDTVSKNISNASTAGYTRKILQQENLIIAGQGVGARALPETRNVNAALIADLNKQTSVSAGYDVQVKYLQRIQDFHGASDSTQSLSAQVTALASAFTDLSSSPSDPGLMASTVSAAQQLAGGINNFSTLLSQMRGDTESDISTAVNTVNQALTTIATLNQSITHLAATGQSTADLEDQRDTAVNTVAQYLNTSTYKNGDTLIVITKQGQVLADTAAHKLYFNQSTMQPDSYYPGGGLDGLHIGSETGTDIAQTDMGGQLGALFNLRDSALPQYQAQLDEFSQQLAERFSNEGLKLFVGANNQVPPDDPTASSPTGYNGFSGQIRVNPAIVSDPNLLRNGTNGGTELSGSNEVIRRVAQFAFGAYKAQQALGTRNINFPTAATVPVNSTVPLTQGVAGTVDLSAYTAGAPGTFTIALGAGAPQTVTVQAGDSATDIAAKINAACGSTVATFDGTHLSLNSGGAITLADGTFALSGLDLATGTTTPLLPVAPRNTVAGSVNLSSYATLDQVPTAGTQLPGTFTLTIGGVPKTITVNAADTPATLVSSINTAFGYTVASINSAGALSLSSTSDIGVAAGSINAAGVSALGLTVGTKAQPAASFQVQVGTRSAVTITIAPGDTTATLLNKLNTTVPGLAATLNASGQLLLQPTEGGDISITDGTGSPLSALGMSVSNVAQDPFPQTGLGPSGTLSSGLLANSTLQDFISNIISTQGEQYNVADNGQAQESSFLQTLQTRNSNTSGVNIDQEMSDLIRIQSAYSAAAKMISAAQQIFDELLNAINR